MIPSLRAHPSRAPGSVCFHVPVASLTVRELQLPRATSICKLRKGMNAHTESFGTLVDDEEVDDPSFVYDAIDKIMGFFY